MKVVIIVLVEVIVCNVVVGSFFKCLGVEEGMLFFCFVVEYCYKFDVLGDLLINIDIVVVLGWVSEDDLKCICELVL